MTMFTQPELADLRRRLAEEPDSVLGDRGLFARLVAQAEHGLDCARLLDEAVHWPAEPYGEAEKLVALLTDGANEIWNRHHWREGQPATAPARGRGEK